MRFADALAAPDQPGAVFAALGALADETVGAKLFTLMTFDAETRLARRIHSNMPDAYPPGGTKPAPETDWTARVLDRHEVFVANTAEEIAAVFFDHAQIAALGCAAALNLPVVVGGRVVGTLNCLDVAGTYTPARVAAAEALRLPGATAFLLYDAMTRGGDR